MKKVEFELLRQYLKASVLEIALHQEYEDVAATMQKFAETDLMACMDNFGDYLEGIGALE